MQVHLWSSKCGRNESPPPSKKKGGGGVKIKLQMKKSNKITFFHFCLLWAKVLINPSRKSLFCSRHISQRCVMELSLNASQDLDELRSSSNEFQHRRLAFFVLFLCLWCKMWVKLIPLKKSRHPKLLRRLYISRKHLVHLSSFARPTEKKITQAIVSRPT